MILPSTSCFYPLSGSLGPQEWGIKSNNAEKKSNHVNAQGTAELHTQQSILGNKFMHLFKGLK